MILRNIVDNTRVKIKNSIKYYKKKTPKNNHHDDIYIVEFPKSGITWLTFLIGNIEQCLNGSKEEITYYNRHKYIPSAELTTKANITRSWSRFFLKSHAEYNKEFHFVIYLVREPIDVMVSYYNFMIALGYKASFETFVKSPSYGISAWKRHVNSWTKIKNGSQRILYVKYEDMLESPELVLKKLYLNLGLGLDAKTINYAIERSSLSYMMESESLYLEANPRYTMPFVGKKGKILKEDLMTKQLENYIKKEVEELKIPI